MNRRLLLSTIFPGSALAVLAPTARVALAADWCEDDPLVLIKTPSGFTLPVHVTNYALGTHAGALKLVHDSPVPPYLTYTVDPVTTKQQEKGKNVSPPLQAVHRWDVAIWILIPGHPLPGDANEGRFKVKAVASVGENATGRIYARDEGWSDNLLRLRFRIEH